MEHLSSFLDVIHRSGLVPAEVISLALEEHRNETQEPSPQSFAKALVTKNIVTRWQANLLLTGKFKGFFLDQYIIRSRVGSGGHANVYLAVHSTLKQNRVIKVLSQDKISRQTSLVDRFIREAQATAKLDHPNIVRCFDIVSNNEITYIVMEYCDGQDLEKLVRKTGPLKFGKCIDYIIQAAFGLQYVKKHGMTHRDIKPSNMMLTNTRQVKILDLGLALLAPDDNEDASLTQMYNDNLGTADYIAPEQARNSHDVDYRADIYSLGCTLYHLLTGRPPFNEGSIVQRVAKHQTEMPPKITDLRPDCPRKLQAICWKMIQKKT